MTESGFCHLKTRPNQRALSVTIRWLHLMLAGGGQTGKIAPTHDSQGMKIIRQNGNF